VDADDDAAPADLALVGNEGAGEGAALSLLPSLFALEADGAAAAAASDESGSLFTLDDIALQLQSI